MRLRLLARYRGVPYEAAVGPSGADVVLFAACPPPEELGFEPAPGHWRKHVIRAELDALWESRPVGTFRGEPCAVLDDLGESLHISYLGVDAGRAASLGYWQVDRGVFELLTPRTEVTGLTEERVPRPLLLPHRPGESVPAGPGEPPLPAPPPADPVGRRAARSTWAPVRELFCELADLAAIPRSAYALDYERDGALCLVRGAGGLDVFRSAGGHRLEARSFADEEAALFYLFGLLAAEAVRTGSLVAAALPPAPGDANPLR